MEGGNFRSNLTAYLKTKSYSQMGRPHAYIQLDLILVTADDVQIPVFAVAAGMAENQTVLAVAYHSGSANDSVPKRGKLEFRILI
jgi:hypothetical protein